VKAAVALAACWAACSVVAAEPFSPLGLWQTIDDHSGQPRGAVRIFLDDGRYFGRVERSLVPGEDTALCIACRDERKNQPIIGMVILRDIRLQDGAYGGGDILDPDSGAVYRCSFQLSDDGRQLRVRGYIGFPLLGRSQVWDRLE
jgi:uncharacterized protein (DUF2147 family)